jgi:hypothetical protein
VEDWTWPVQSKYSNSSLQREIPYREEEKDVERVMASLYRLREKGVWVFDYTASDLDIRPQLG